MTVARPARATARARQDALHRGEGVALVRARRLARRRIRAQNPPRAKAGCSRASACRASGRGAAAARGSAWERPVSTKLRCRVETPARFDKSSWLMRRCSRHWRRSASGAELGLSRSTSRTWQRRHATDRNEPLTYAHHDLRGNWHADVVGGGCTHGHTPITRRNKRGVPAGLGRFANLVRPLSASNSPRRLAARAGPSVTWPATSSVRSPRSPPAISKAKAPRPSPSVRSRLGAGGPPPSSPTRWTRPRSAIGGLLDVLDRRRVERARWRRLRRLARPRHRGAALRRRRARRRHRRRARPRPSPDQGRTRRRGIARCLDLDDQGFNAVLALDGYDEIAIGDVAVRCASQGTPASSSSPPPAAEILPTSASTKR